MEGKVKWFSTTKGYGFITENETDYFIHNSDLEQGITLRENDHVSFDTEQTERGTKAVNVKLI